MSSSAMPAFRYRAHMLLVILAATLSVASCEQRCASEADRCYANCQSSTKCSHHCDGRSADCNALATRPATKSAFTLYGLPS